MFFFIGFSRIRISPLQDENGRLFGPFLRFRSLAGGPKTITPPGRTGGATMGLGGRLSKVPNGAQLFMGRRGLATFVLAQSRHFSPAQPLALPCERLLSGEPSVYTLTDKGGGDPGVTRTPGLRFRKPPLYPAELRGHARVFCSISGCEASVGRDPKPTAAIEVGRIGDVAAHARPDRFGL